MNDKSFRKKEKTEKINGIIQEKFPKLRYISFRNERGYQCPSTTLDGKGPTSKHIVVKFQNTGAKGYTLHASRE